MASERVQFENASGIRLAGIIDWPAEDAPISAFAVFSHCFTCSKDLKAIVRISRGLAKHGIAVLRFDFTGLGDSKGNFSETNFDNNLADVDAAVSFLERNHQAPTILIGHSLGGAAMMVKSRQIPSARVLVTIASPSTTEHLANFLSTTNPKIESEGEGVVEIGGRHWTMRKQLIENLRSLNLPAEIEQISIPHLIMHPPEDETLPYWHAEELFRMTGGPKSMVTLVGSDHLLVKNKEDVAFVAELINLWATRYM